MNSKISILLVDDRPDGLLALEAALEAPDYCLVKASSGPEALALLEGQDFAVILLDIQMPSMDGFETATLIRRRPQTCRTPIIFITAINKDPRYIYQGYEAGAVDYLFKPFDPHILKAKVAVFAELFRKNAEIKRQADILRQKDQELYNARKMEAIGRLAGGVAHDFNNLIAGILGISRDVHDRLEEGDPRRKDLEEIVGAGERAFLLTNQLLAFGRRQPISPQTLNLNEVIQGLHAMLRRLLREDIELKMVLKADLGVVRADRGHLEQVIINLLLNARDAMPEGGRISVTTSNVQVTPGSRPLLAPGSYVCLSVIDTGCGMSAETVSRIFEPFFTTKEQGKGTGLGLATVYGIAMQHEGDIEVQSELGHGSSFNVYLPQTNISAEMPHPSVASDSLQGQETILLVEDERIVREVVTRMLRKSGYSVLAAAGGDEAIRLLEKQSDPVPLLITDVVMPQMNGKRLAEIIRDKCPETAVIFMSGYAEDVMARNGILDPSIVFIEKSQIFEKLLPTVRQTLDQKPSAPPSFSLKVL